LSRKQLNTRITLTSYKQQSQLSTRNSENERSERTASPDRRSVPRFFLMSERSELIEPLGEKKNSEDASEVGRNEVTA
jgi:hypothetical protein